MLFVISNVSYTNEAAKKRISLTERVMPNLTKFIKYLEVSTNTNVKLQQTKVFQAVLYGCKGMQIKLRLMITWRVSSMNTSVTNQITPKEYLGTLATNGQF